MRDHTKLRAFELADALAVLTYRTTASFPREEQFGLTSQMRRAAVSIASNIVEGCSRSTDADYLRFLEIAYGSARELEYQINLVGRLNLIGAEHIAALQQLSIETSKVLNGLLRALRANRK